MTKQMKSAGAKKSTKNKTAIIVAAIVAVLLIVAIVAGVLIMRKNNHFGEESIYSNCYYFGMGSRCVEIYANGDVYDDVEIEDPRHQANFQFVKTLNASKLAALKSRLEQTKDGLSEYVMELVYCTDEFGALGQYPQCD